MDLWKSNNVKAYSKNQISSAHNEGITDQYRWMSSHNSDDHNVTKEKWRPLDYNKWSTEEEQK